MSTNATKRPINIYSETFSLCKRIFRSRSLVPIDEDIVPVWLFRGFENLVRVRCSGGTTVVFSNLLKVLFCNMENMIFFRFLINIPCSLFDRFPCVKGYEKLNSVIIKLRLRNESLVVYMRILSKWTPRSNENESRLKLTLRKSMKISIKILSGISYSFFPIGHYNPIQLVWQI